MPEASLRTSSSSLLACRPRWRYWSWMLVMTLCAIDTAASAVVKVVLMVQSSVVSGPGQVVEDLEDGGARPGDAGVGEAVQRDQRLIGVGDAVGAVAVGAHEHLGARRAPRASAGRAVAAADGSKCTGVNAEPGRLACGSWGCAGSGWGHTPRLAV